MRATLDANTVVSALLFGGIPLDIISLAEASTIELATSPPALDELRKVLLRPCFSARLRAIALSADVLLTRYRQMVIIVEPGDPPSICRDDSDNVIIAAAVAGMADVIVSGDRHLLDCGERSPVPVVTAAEFLKTCREMFGLSRYE